MASSGQQALNQLLRESHQLVILDLAMPELDGTATLERIRQLLPDLAIIVLTANASLESCVEHIKKGANSYMAKPFRVEKLEAAIQSLLNPFSHPTPSAVKRPRRSGFTGRERDVLVLMRMGLEDKEIAQQLTLSVRTVHHHVAVILTKLGANNRTDAVAKTYRERL